MSNFIVDSRFVYPIIDRFSLQLISPVSWEIIPGTRLVRNEDLFPSPVFFSCFFVSCSFLHNYWLSKIFPISYELNQQASNLVSSFTSWQKFSQQHSNWPYGARLVQWSDQFGKKTKSNPKKNREFVVLKNSFRLYIKAAYNQWI